MSAPNLSFKSRRLFKLTFANRLPRNVGNTGSHLQLRYGLEAAADERPIDKELEGAERC